MDIDNGRALYYGFLGNFLDFNTIATHKNDLKEALSFMLKSPLDDVKPLQNLHDFLSRDDFVKAYNESYTKVFLFDKVPLFYSSYKDPSKGVQGKDYLFLKQYLSKYPYKIRKDFKESEEHLGFLLLFMHYLIINKYDKKKQKNFLNSYLRVSILGLIKKLSLQENIWKDYASILQSFYSFDSEFLNS